MEEIISRIMAYRAELESSDYKCLKYAEGALNEEEYAPIKARRQELRDLINDLETQLAEMTAP